MTSLRVLSLGGGTQSCALALMSARGDLPRLDAVIFADTQGEVPETYGYLWWLAGEMAEAGIPLIIETAGDLYADLLVDVPKSKNPTPPVHVLNPDGSKGRIPQYRCSYDYKRMVVERTIKRLCGGRGAWKRATVEQWIGYSADETNRVKTADECRCGHKRVARKGRTSFTRIHTDADGCSRCSCEAFDPWLTNRWPLIDMEMKREDTIRWFVDNDYPVPPRSACYFCPNSRNERWQELRDTNPDMFEAACVLDETIRHGGGFNARGNVPFAGQMFLHESLVPLRSADLRTKRQRIRDAGQFELFDMADDCNTGICFT